MTWHDWWRGWSDADLVSVLNKVAQDMAPGSMIPVTERELRAHVAYIRDQYPLRCVTL